jgi:hypothetical protein
MTDVLPSNSTQSSLYWIYVDDSSCLGGGTSQIQLYSSPMLTGMIGINGAPVTVVSTVPGQETQLTFTPTHNQSVSLETSNSTYLCGGQYFSYLDPTATLTDPNGNYVDSADFCESPSFGPNTLSTNGIYTITVEPFGPTGSVDLTLTSP